MKKDVSEGGIQLKWSLTERAIARTTLEKGAGRSSQRIKIDWVSELKLGSGADTSLSNPQGEPDCHEGICKRRGALEAGGRRKGGNLTRVG